MSMSLGALLGGYRTSVKKKLGKQYQKWLETVQGSGSSANKHFEELVRYELQNGIIDFKSFSAPGKAQEKQAAQVTENLGMLGMIQKMSDMMAEMSVNNALATVEQTNALAIVPMREQVEELRLQREQGQRSIDELRGQWDETIKGTKEAGRTLTARQDAIHEANAELSKLQSKITQAKSQVPYQAQQPINNVSSRTDTDAKVPLERDAKGHFKKRGKDWTSEAKPEGQSEES